MRVPWSILLGLLQSPVLSLQLLLPGLLLPGLRPMLPRLLLRLLRQRLQLVDQILLLLLEKRAREFALSLTVPSCPEPEQGGELLCCLTVH